ncbi:MAG: 6-pyruvoyl trahydropterin synthase family protein [Planctomycetota bacterium]|jgi:6-pyruvoyltetrahydropterin/6-carboxytetrahydropterin synthase
MHKLAREVRFSINPFLERQKEGFNSYASKPAGKGLALFFELAVTLAGDVEPSTGFVANVVEVDRCVRKYVVPIFAERIGKSFRAGEGMALCDVAELLRGAWGQLADKFAKAKIAELSLKLSPFRKLAVDCEDCKMIYFSEKFEFAASHKLWNDDFTEQRNFEVFGKCANPSGHGHNYVIEVTVKAPVAAKGFCIGDFERVVNDELIELVDHKNLNVEIPAFSGINPTVENIAVFAWDKIAGKFGEAELACVTVWETDKTCSSYYG